jgi:hypothetical protein
MIIRMQTLSNSLLAALLPLILLGCSSTEEKPARPRADPTPENPMVFNLDMSTPMPLVSVLATREAVVRLRGVYSSFFVEMGSAAKGGMLSLRFDKKGSLGIPWNFYLRNFSSPYPVRLMGVLPDGKKEVVHEETF